VPALLDARLCLSAGARTLDREPGLICSLGKIRIVDNVILVGFMGAGKSTIGRLLARRLNRCFVETDDMIVARTGRSIPDIFREGGEVHFRALETEAVELLRLKQGDVIATGGGLPCREGRMQALRGLGTVVWLTAEFAELYERARRSGERPLLQQRSRQELEALARDRERYYRQAHLTVDTHGLGVDQVVGRLLRELRHHAAPV
jgi:shikimate kinase